MDPAEGVGEGARTTLRVGARTRGRHPALPRARARSRPIALGGLPAAQVRAASCDRRHGSGARPRRAGVGHDRTGRRNARGRPGAGSRHERDERRPRAVCDPGAEGAGRPRGCPVAGLSGQARGLRSLAVGREGADRGPCGGSGARARGAPESDGSRGQAGADPHARQTARPRSDRARSPGQPGLRGMGDGSVEARVAAPDEGRGALAG